MLVGYARVSAEYQKLDLQFDALTSAGCEKFFSDHVSGVSKLNAGLYEVRAYLRSGDTLVVRKLDRLSRTVTGNPMVVNTVQATFVMPKAHTGHQVGRHIKFWLFWPVVRQ